MKKSFFYCVCLIVLSCSPKSKPEDLNLLLKSTMADYLNSDPKSIGKYKYEVASVTFFDNETYYICEFNVRMTNDPTAPNVKKIDTVGAMKVRIDKNFKVISRYY